MILEKGFDITVFAVTDNNKESILSRKNTQNCLNIREEFSADFFTYSISFR